MPVLVKRLKAGVNTLLSPLGFRLVSSLVHPWEPTLAAGLARLAARNLPLRTLIDVGAADGAWTRRALAALPSLQHQLLIEPQSAHRDALAIFQRDFPRAQLAHSVAGPACGKVSFHAQSPWDGVASAAGEQGTAWVRLPQTTLDHEVATRGLPGPFVIKLDVHGYERAILRGARSTLVQTQALIIECYNVSLGGESLRFPEFCQHMESLGFRCADLWDPLYLGRQNTLWQFDLLFLRSDVVAASDRTALPA
ncbi:MAG TPA: FkbM family methyltransferase [Opitutus sp.]|nr:FkbM family methyltransferase [Opitutus sp.]